MAVQLDFTLDPIIKASNKSCMYWKYYLYEEYKHIQIYSARQFTQDAAKGKQSSQVYCVYTQHIGNISNLYYIETVS